MVLQQLQLNYNPAGKIFPPSFFSMIEHLSSSVSHSAAEQGVYNPERFLMTEDDMKDSFGARSTLRVGEKEYEIFRLQALAGEGFAIDRLPYSLRILLENLLRNEDGVTVTGDDIRALAGWQGKKTASPGQGDPPGWQLQGIFRHGSYRYAACASFWPGRENPPLSAAPWPQPPSRAPTTHQAAGKWRPGPKDRFQPAIPPLINRCSRCVTGKS